MSYSATVPPFILCLYPRNPSRNSLRQRILRITLLLRRICAQIPAISMKTRNLGERGEGGTNRP